MRLLERRIRGLAVAMLSLPLAAGLWAGEESPDVPGTIQYLAIGARNDANVATVVSCTNVGPWQDTVGVTFLGAAGGSVCNLSAVDLSVNSTATFATQPVDAIPGATTCGDPGPVFVAGVVQMGGYPDVRCSAFLIAPGSTSPSFAVALQVYPAH